jgi:hypothetical protein
MPTTRTFNLGPGAGPFSALQVLRLATAGVCTLLARGETGADAAIHSGGAMPYLCSQLTTQFFVNMS